MNAGALFLCDAVQGAGKLAPAGRGRPDRGHRAQALRPQGDRRAVGARRGEDWRTDPRRRAGRRVCAPARSALRSAPGFGAAAAKLAAARDGAGRRSTSPRLVECWPATSSRAGRSTAAPTRAGPAISICGWTGSTSPRLMSDCPQLVLFSAGSACASGTGATQPCAQRHRAFGRERGEELDPARVSAAIRPARTWSKRPAARSRPRPQAQGE
jgi:cysteine desulfurase